ncbi:MAG: AAA family ATPase, partial [Anaerolineae bacterium]|nr:AAA family ATPase [Anaerolineae bacterium]
MFKDVGQITSALGEQQYISTDEISTVIFLADQLQKPVLTEGPAGVGKTELAKAWAKANGRQLIRLQCYEGLDESKALYEWEYAKQMLYTQLLRDKLSELLANAGSLTDAADRLGQEENVFFSERFLLARPLLQAITAPEPVVLLIDEIDRADA